MWVQTFTINLHKYDKTALRNAKNFNWPLQPPDQAVQQPEGEGSATTLGGSG